MHYRTLGKTGYRISDISYGAWSLGADWGDVTESDAIDTLQSAVERGVNFIDTADVYGDGRSETLIAKWRKTYTGDVIVATKIGRRLDPHTAAGYTEKNLTAFVERSLKNLEVSALDLVQLHCPPTSVYYMPEVFDILDRLVTAGKIKHYGVSVEKVEEGMKALQYPGVATVQIIFNMFRQRPAERFFAMAKEKNVGIIVRVPLASGLLTGVMSPQSSFAANDHRQYNRHGEKFDVGETFAGVDFATGLAAVNELKDLIPSGYTLPQMALKWILMHPQVSAAIPGGKRPEQIAQNAAASDMPELDSVTLDAIRTIYDQKIRPLVHERW